MIPIGTRCILVYAVDGPWLPHVGKVLEVVGYREYRGKGTHVVEFLDGTQICGAFGRPMIKVADPPDIIPIGHDPDAETRKTGREVGA